VARVPLFLIPPIVPTPREGWVHVPTPQATQALRALGDEPIWRESHCPRPQQRFEHALLVTWFGFVTSRDCRQSPWQCWNYLADRHLAAARADGARYPMIPDGHFIITNLSTGHNFTHFFEIDRGFTTGSGRGNRADWVAKIRDYATYLGPAGGWAADFGPLPRPVVLIVTVSPRRAETILAAIAEAGGNGAYWVTTFDEVATTGLWGAIWRVVSEAEPRSLETRCRS
jgi:hypothetical protein